MELGPTSLKELVQSEVIGAFYVERLVDLAPDVTAKVQKRIKNCPPACPVAQAVLLRPLKGKGLVPGRRIALAAYSSWMCDATEVHAKTHRLYFLNAKDEQALCFAHELFPDFNQRLKKTLGPLPLYFIAHSGAGELPLILTPQGLEAEVSRCTSPLVGVHHSSGLVPLPDNLPIRWSGRPRRDSDGTEWREGTVPVSLIEDQIRRLLPPSQQIGPLRRAIF